MPGFRGGPESFRHLRFSDHQIPSVSGVPCFRVICAGPHSPTAELTAPCGAGLGVILIHQEYLRFPESRGEDLRLAREVAPRHRKRMLVYFACFPTPSPDTSWHTSSEVVRSRAQCRTGPEWGQPLSGGAAGPGDVSASPRSRFPILPPLAGECWSRPIGRPTLQGLCAPLLGLRR